MEKEIRFNDIKNSDEIRQYIERADLTLKACGYTEHSFAHAGIVAKVAGDLLHDLGYPDSTVELARIAGYMHDIGNVINRDDHAQSGAVMAFRILEKMGMSTENIARIISAIGNHDENTAVPVDEIAAALILADKTDVRRSRVRCKHSEFDIHDRVNYAVVDNRTILDVDSKTFTQRITIDTDIASAMNYFEIYMQRVLLSRRAAEFLGLQFKLTVNGSTIF
ncbi:MAG: HD domain-containing protein [Muribaculaceae bacterium]|nr:HD domain-containing protein [Muribaculaceae bacterium]